MSVTGKAERVALAALAVTVALTITKLLVWRVTGSIAVLSQALDSALDIVALSLVFLGVRIAGKPADASHHYGHAKAENLAAFTQTLILLAIVAYVALEAGRRLVGEPAEVTVPWYALALFAGSVPVDGVRVWFLTRAARAERSDALAAGALDAQQPPAPQPAAADGSSTYGPGRGAAVLPSRPSLARAEPAGRRVGGRRRSPP